MALGLASSISRLDEAGLPPSVVPPAALETVAPGFAPPPDRDAPLADLTSDMAQFPQLVAVQQKNYFDFARLSIVFAAFPGGYF